MAAKDSPSFDELPEAETSDDTDGNWIDLEPGDEVSGTITSWNPDAGRNGVLEIDGRPMHMTAAMERALISSLVDGGVVAVRKSEDEESFENDDGETVTYNPREARFGRGDD